MNKNDLVFDDRYHNEFAKQWITEMYYASETGRYKQGKYSLCTEYEDIKFCCLGIAEDLAGTFYKMREGTTHRLYKNTIESGFKKNFYVPFTGDYLTRNTKDRLGLISMDGSTKHSLHPSLVYMNDQGESFKKIAIQLLTYPQAYFKKKNR